jgi:hypothetical protein
MIPCIHGGSPWHWICDLWWAFLLGIPFIKVLLSKYGYVVKSWCCGHKVIKKNTHDEHFHCDH